MRVLAIDTALGACAAAVLDSERGAILASESLAMLRGHAEAVMPLIARVMDAGRCEFSDLDRIAVTVGPGSFTGLRVGIAAAPRRATQPMSGAAFTSTRAAGDPLGQCAATSAAPEPVITVGPTGTARTAARTRSSRGVTMVVPFGANTWK